MSDIGSCNSTGKKKKSEELYYDTAIKEQTTDMY